MTAGAKISDWLQQQTDVTVREIYAGWLQLGCKADQLVTLTTALVNHWQAEFATLLVEETSAEAPLAVHYLFYLPEDGCLIELKILVRPGEELPAISDTVHAADWHEREAWDLYGLRFSGHPFLGDFVLHDDDWPEGLDPMRHRFDGRRRPDVHGSGANWVPPKIIQEEGSILWLLVVSSG